MTRRRFSIWDLAFAVILLVALPAAIFHVIQGRYANALVATAALAIGVIVLWVSMRQAESQEPVMPAPSRPARAPRPHREPGRSESGRVIDWLPRGLISGFVAAGLMTLVLVVAYGIAAAIGSAEPGASIIQRWAAGLVDNTLAETAQANLPTALVLHFVAGIVWAILYAGFVEQRLSGPGWRRGVIFSVLPWLLSLIVFLPAAGGGFLGLSLGAGPMPIIGNLILHLVYGITLGEVYANETLLTESGEVEDADEPRTLARVERMMALSLVPGLLLGGFIGLIGSSVFAPGQDPAMVAIFGALAGSAVGILLGSFAGAGTPAREP